MKVRSHSAPAFSLFVKVAPALGVAVFFLIAMFGNYSLLPVAEIQPTPGVLADANNKNMVAILAMGVGANNKRCTQ